MTRPPEERSFAPRAVLLDAEDIERLQRADARVAAAAAAGVGVEEAELCRRTVHETIAARLQEGA